MKLLAVNIGHAVRYDMAMQMLPILVDSDHTLVTGEKTVGKFFSDFQNFRRGNIFVFMETDDIMRVHPAGILIP